MAWKQVINFLGPYQAPSVNMIISAEPSSTLPCWIIKQRSSKATSHGKYQNTSKKGNVTMKDGPCQGKESQLLIESKSTMQRGQRTRDAEKKRLLIKRNKTRESEATSRGEKMKKIRWLSLKIDKNEHRQNNQLKSFFLNHL